MIEWIINYFKPFKLPNHGDKVGFSDKILKKGYGHGMCYEVQFAVGHKKKNVVMLKCKTVLYEGEWKLLPKETPTRY